MRKNLERLEGEGLVSHEAVVFGVGKPAHMYAITAEGERVRSSACMPLLRALLSVLEDRLPPADLDAVVRQAGQRLVPPSAADAAGLRARVDAAALLDRLGGIAAPKEDEGTLVIECTCCAVGSVVLDHPVICNAMAALLAELVAAPVRQRCRLGERPHCRFEVRVQDIARVIAPSLRMARCGAFHPV